MRAASPPPDTGRFSKRIKPIADNPFTERTSKSDALILTFEADNNHPILKCPEIHNTIGGIFTALKYNVLNAAPAQRITLQDSDVGRISKDTYRALKKCGGELTLVIAKHGKFHELFSENRHEDISAIRTLSESIKYLEDRAGCKFKNIILFSCMSACELKSANRVIFDNRSPARIFSENMPDTDVYGFNGTALHHVETRSHINPEIVIKTSLVDNAVAFRAGKVTKASTHPDQGRGLVQSYKSLHARSDSFSSEVGSGLS